MARSDTPAFCNDNLRLCLDIKGRGLATQTFRHQVKLDFFLAEVKLVGLEKYIEHLLIVITERA